mmetsp:Transcript_7566/g.21674  ORF Transcript_7566/g.21674 Transcript_7566/m.21674 type:complete len:416 (+) Transcript_7566:2-1249(+)
MRLRKMSTPRKLSTKAFQRAHINGRIHLSFIPIKSARDRLAVLPLPLAHQLALVVVAAECATHKAAGVPLALELLAARPVVVLDAVAMTLAVRPLSLVPDSASVLVEHCALALFLALGPCPFIGLVVGEGTAAQLWTRTVVITVFGAVSVSQPIKKASLVFDVAVVEVFDDLLALVDLVVLPLALEVRVAVRKIGDADSVAHSLAPLALVLFLVDQIAVSFVVLDALAVEHTLAPLSLVALGIGGHIRIGSDARRQDAPALRHPFASGALVFAVHVLQDGRQPVVSRRGGVVLEGHKALQTLVLLLKDGKLSAGEVALADGFHLEAGLFEQTLMEESLLDVQVVQLVFEFVGCHVAAGGEHHGLVVRVHRSGSSRLHGCSSNDVKVREWLNKAWGRIGIQGPLNGALLMALPSRR